MLRCSTSEQALYRLLRLFSKVRARSFCCSSSPNRTRLAGLRFGFGTTCSHCIFFVAIIQKNATCFDESHFLLGFAPVGRSTLRWLKCSGEVNSPCVKVLPVAKRLYGAKAPPARRPVGCFSRKIANDLRGFGLLPLAKTRNRCSFYCGDFSLDRPISSAGGAARKKSFNIKHRVKWAANMNLPLIEICY